MIIGGVGAPIWTNMAIVVMFVIGGLSFTIIVSLMVLMWAIMIMAFVSVYYIFKGRRFKLALAGAICSAIGITFITGLLAVIFLAKR
jgi:hypothetical protein